MIMRACVTCGVPSKGNYCRDHERKPWQTSRRKERLGLSGGAWETLRRKVLARDMGCCYLCDEQGADEVDHLVELAAGGTNDMDNLASCHGEPCHARKHREPEWAAERIRSAQEALRGWGATPVRDQPMSTAGVARGARQNRNQGGRSQ